MLIPLRHGEPIRVGADNEKSVALDTQGDPRIAAVADVGEAAILVHDEARDDPSLAFTLSRLARGPFEPTPIGVFRAITRPEYVEATSQQLAAAVEQKGPGDLEALLHSGATWTI
jgi:2-oxoglutarate ferredoxin oxidoreductase subunit beta